MIYFIFRASLNLHEYDESKLCLTKLLEIQEMELNQLQTNSSIPSTEGIISINDPITPETLPLKIEELQKGIATTKQWLNKVEIAKKKYRVSNNDHFYNYIFFIIYYLLFIIHD